MCEEKESFLKALKERRKLDIIKGFTTRGILRDDFLIYINGKEINALFKSSKIFSPRRCNKNQQPLTPESWSSHLVCIPGGWLVWFCSHPRVGMKVRWVRIVHRFSFKFQLRAGALFLPEMSALSILFPFKQIQMISP